MKVKVCGIADTASMAAIGELGADYIGHIFYDRSPRYVEGRLTTDSIRQQPEPPIKVGVFVNESQDEIRRICEACGISTIQLHGDESPADCNLLRMEGLTVIKALSIQTRDDLDKAQLYQDSVDFLLFDTKSSSRGGSGQKFDWSVLHDYNGELSFFLSGGIGPGDVEEIGRLAHPKMYALDINSRFELRPGVKDAGLVAKFINDVKQSVHSK